MIQTFDPESGTFHTMRSEPIPVTVEVDPEDGSHVYSPRIDSESPIQLHGVRHNRFNERKMISIHNLLEFFGPVMVVVRAVAPVALARPAVASYAAGIAAVTIRLTRVP